MKNPPFFGDQLIFFILALSVKAWRCSQTTALCLENMIPPKFQIIKNFEVGIQVQDFFLILSLPTCWGVCGSDLLRSNKVELKIVLPAFLWAIASKQLGHYSKIGGVNEKKKKMRSIISATNLVELSLPQTSEKRSASGKLEIEDGNPDRFVYHTFVQFRSIWKFHIVKNY